ncbi:histidine triad (HIT) family protein [Litorivivens lipolytica]|uniref:Histidine triad (HIT) family protein n=1 Tax=Litorivivens lipolytica TaxID=1524264 RepID=A0A7W4W1V2_9GAMM|nr:HIT family protein [Litorivivens lipolytica]MBB3045908.1 histidine triad (HIT) family protein [Litorivivens lipolytica]
MDSTYDTNNIFAKILAGEAPCIKVYEDNLTLAFMDIMPQTDGHVLVIPKERAVTIYDLSVEAAQACMLTVQKVGKAVERAMGVTGSTIFQHNGRSAGQTVGHFHFHVLPGPLSGLKGHGVTFEDTDKLQQIAELIIAELADL